MHTKSSLDDRNVTRELLNVKKMCHLCWRNVTLTSQTCAGIRVLGEGKKKKEVSTNFFLFIVSPNHVSDPR